MTVELNERDIELFKTIKPTRLFTVLTVLRDQYETDNARRKVGIPGIHDFYLTAIKTMCDGVFGHSKRTSKLDSMKADIVDYYKTCYADCKQRGISTMMTALHFNIGYSSVNRIIREHKGK
jgi:hypothetical protein